MLPNDQQTKDISIVAISSKELCDLSTNIMANKAECDKRKHLRYQLFTGEASNTPGKKLPEESWLVPKWEKYIELNFKLKEPGSEKAVAEFREMVASHETPNYNGSSARGQVAKSIPPRKLGNMEFRVLETLLPFYENTLQNKMQTQEAPHYLTAIWQKRNLRKNLRQSLFHRQVVQSKKNENRRLARRTLGKVHRT